MTDWKDQLCAAASVLLILLGVPLLLCLAMGIPIAGARDRTVPAEFQRLYPCPSTGQPTGACPGWQKDHVMPLCRGGADTVENLQWLTVAQHKMKTRGDCRALPGQ